MNREQAKELLPIIQAFAEGKTIQAKKAASEQEWQHAQNPTFAALFEWRIKPEPREYWLLVHDEGETTNLVFDIEEDAHGSCLGGQTVIKVLEVIED